MSEHGWLSGRWSALSRTGRSVGAKLFFLLAFSLFGVLGSIGYINTRFHQDDLEESTLSIAETVGNVIERSTEYNMLRNDREAVARAIQTVGGEPNVVSIRIFNREGRVSFSTNPSEIGTVVNKTANTCRGCHEGKEPLVELHRADRFWIYRTADQRVVSVINPIRNSQSCYEADCHAHSPEDEILGILDTSLSLAFVDEHIQTSKIQIVVLSVVGLLGIVSLTGAFIWKVVHKPVERLRVATEHLRTGDLGYELTVQSNDQIGELAISFNDMSRQLREASEKLTDWNRVLEERIKAKTDELQSAHEQMLQAEKLTSLGKLAAVVAHEINNPLSGILTYARLLRRRIDRGESLDAQPDENRDTLRLIESESRRCGDLVNDLLAFSRQSATNVQPVDLNGVIKTCCRLVEHKLDLSSIALDLNLDEALPSVNGDRAQLEQLMLALIMNSVEAMTHEGCLSITTESSETHRAVLVTIRDNGIGIPSELLPRLFEPFVTTKENSTGVGLGLAISKQIVDKHCGRIEVTSEPGQGATFVVVLPIEFGDSVAGKLG